MAPEIKGKEKLAEIEPNRILAVRFRTAEAVSDLQPVLVGPHYNDETNLFVKSAIKASEQKVKELEDPANYKKKGRDLRGQRELRDVMAQNAAAIGRVQQDILVLKGERPGLVEIKLDEQGIQTGLTVETMPDNQRGLWDPIYNASRTAGDKPKALELIVKGFNLRYQMRFGNYTEQANAIDNYRNFMQEFGNFLDANESLDNAMSSAMSSISKTLTA